MGEMVMTKTLPQIPMISSYYSPEEIIRSANMDIFTKHYGICSSAVNAGGYPEKLLNKEIGQTDRADIAETYVKLREHGYYPLHLDPRGKIAWGFVAKSDSHKLFESGLAELEGKNLEELKEYARAGYREVVKK